MHRLTKAQARRIAVRAQLLDAPRPTELLTVVQKLSMLQIDPTAAIAPSADLVVWSRLGSAYQPAHLQQALEQDRTLFEHNALVRPMSDLGLYLAGAAEWPSYERTRAWIRDNDHFRRDILEVLDGSGPLTSREIPDTCVVPWASTGWTNNRNVTQMLECLMMRGEVAIAGRVGRERLWDLAERVYPPDVVVPSADEALRAKNERRLASLGIARQKARAMPVEPIDVGEAGEPAVVEDTKGEWRVDPAALGDHFAGRTALLSPFDRLVHDRVRAQELFDFEYTLEMYKPAAKRRWGYFALPVLHDDRLVGKVDATADRKASVLRVHAIHEDVRFTRTDDEGRAGRAGGPGLVARPGCGRGGLGHGVRGRRLRRGFGDRSDRLLGLNLADLPNTDRPRAPQPSCGPRRPSTPSVVVDPQKTIGTLRKNAKAPASPSAAAITTSASRGAQRRRSYTGNYSADRADDDRPNLTCCTCQSSDVARVMDAEGAHLAAMLRAADFHERRVLEVGSGVGRLTWGFAPLAASVLAFDPVEGDVATARADCPEELREKIRFEVARAEEIDVPPHSVDLVFFSWSL